MGGHLEEEYMLRNLRQHALVNNEITESCFTSCVGGLIDRTLSDAERVCVESCAAKLISASMRTMLKVAEANPVAPGQRN